MKKEKKDLLLKKDLTKLEINILFDRHSTFPKVQNQIAKAKDFLAIEVPLFWNNINFVGGSTIEEQNQSVSRFVIFTDKPTDIKAYFLGLFRGQMIYISVNNSIPIKTFINKI